MSIGKERTVNLSVLLGANNRSPDHRLRTKDGSFVRSAANMDITDGFTAKRRDGYTEVAAATNARGAWTDELADAGYFVDGRSLYRAKPAGAGLAMTLLAADLAPTAPVSFTRMGQEVVFTDGATIRVVDVEETVVRPLGATGLAAAPAVSAGGGGSLKAGYYSVAFAHANAGREVSPLTPPAQVLVADNGAIVVSGLPAWPADATELHVYVAPLNSDVLLLEARLTAFVSSLTIPVLSGAGRVAATQHMIALPPGRILRWYAGRLLCAAGNTLWYSDVYSPALCRPTQGFVDFPAPITVLEPCDDGIYLAADATYWLQGDITQTVAKVVSPTRGVFGSGGQQRLAKRCHWMTEQGLAIGAPGGEIEFPQAETIAVSRGEYGASLHRESDGQRHLIASLFGASGSTAARSYMDAEVIRKGTSL